MGRSLENLELAPDLSRLPSNVLHLIRNGGCGQYPNRSEARVAVCAAMFWAGYSVAKVWMVMTDSVNGISEGFSRRTGNGPKPTWSCSSPRRTRRPP